MSQQLARQSELKTELVSVQKQIESLLVDKDRAKKFLAASLVIANNANLSNCSTNSIAQALVGVAMLDLNIDPNIGHVYLVPYRDSVQMQVGYKGMIQLLFRAGWAVKAFPVYTCDDFSMQFDGWDNKVSFTPNIDARDDGDKQWTFESLRGVYVVARHADTKDEYSTFVGKSTIEKLRLNSQNQKIGKYTKPDDVKRLNAGLPIGIWADWYAEMCMAKAVKKLAKTLPIGDSRAVMSISLDDAAETGKQVDYKQSFEAGMVIEGESKTVAQTSSVNDIIESSAVVEESEQEPITEQQLTIADDVNACNTLADLARMVASLDPAIKAENKNIIIARQEAIKEARKAANNV